MALYSEAQLDSLAVAAATVARPVGGGSCHVLTDGICSGRPPRLCHARDGRRHRDLPARRPPGQGRPGQHGAQPRVPRAVSGPPGRRAGRRHAARPKDQAYARAVLRSCSSRHLPNSCHRRSRPARRWALAFRSADWFRDELKNELSDVLLDPVCLNRGIFRPEAIEKLVTDHIARETRTFISPLGTPHARIVVSDASGSAGLEP